ncbi:unnamed protein product [Heligmosomoides polygyrus]|uniref:Uncharacterized protein n=1 Tax=Heligmosomoides polygyrus TaxID=6339 RepID=A0A3P7XF42_HELPZ|nr:unnamed protein product [Heligmosomoides polygyrus]
MFDVEAAKIDNGFTLERRHQQQPRPHVSVATLLPQKHHTITFSGPRKKFIPLTQVDRWPPPLRGLVMPSASRQPIAAYDTATPWNPVTEMGTIGRSAYSDHVEAYTLPRSIGSSQPKHMNGYNYKPDYCVTLGRVRPTYEPSTFDENRRFATMEPAQSRRYCSTIYIDNGNDYGTIKSSPGGVGGVQKKTMLWAALKRQQLRPDDKKQVSRHRLPFWVIETEHSLSPFLTCSRRQKNIFLPPNARLEVSGAF